MNKTGLFMIVLALFTLTGALIALNNRASAVVSHAMTTDLGNNPVAQSALSTLGSPAIQPHLKAVPAFTEQDVRQYVNTSQTRSLGPKVAVTGPFTIEKVIFLTEQELTALPGGIRTGLPSQTLVCYVELRGTFVISGPPGFTIPPYSKGFEVFDAATGNLLVNGATP